MAGRQICIVRGHLCKIYLTYSLLNLLENFYLKPDNFSFPCSWCMGFCAPSSARLCGQQIRISAPVLFWGSAKIIMGPFSLFPRGWAPCSQVYVVITPSLLHRSLGRRFITDSSRTNQILSNWGLEPRDLFYSLISLMHRNRGQPNV